VAELDGIEWHLQAVGVSDSEPGGGAGAGTPRVVLEVSVPDETVRRATEGIGAGR